MKYAVAALVLASAGCYTDGSAAKRPLAPQAPPPAPTSVPPAFAKLAAERASDLGMHVDDWWQDDLDGDGKPEDIAALCAGSTDGVYLIDQQGTVLVARRMNFGRETCNADAVPTWHVEHVGFINHSSSVHRASEIVHIAVRDHRAVSIYEGVDGSEGGYDLDWEALTLSTRNDDGSSVNAVQIVGIADADPRWTTIGAVALSAVVVGDKVVLHVKGGAQVTFCKSFEATPCEGDRAQPINGDVEVPESSAKVPGSQVLVEIAAGGARARAILVRADKPLIGGYPSVEPSADRD